MLGKNVKSSFRSQSLPVNKKLPLAKGKTEVRIQHFF